MLQNKQNRLRRRAVRLLLLIAALFALSPTADAGFGTWDGTKYTVQMNGHPIGGWNGFKDMTKVDDNHYSVEFTPTTTDVMSFRLKINGKEYGPTDNNSNTTLSEGYQQAWLTDYSNWEKKEGAWLIYPSTGYKYTLHFWYSYDSQMKFNLEKTSIGASTIPSSLYFRTDANAWEDPIPMTKSSDGKKFSHTIDPYTANSIVKFHFRQNQNDWNGYQLFPNTDGASAVVGSNTIDNFKENGSDPNMAWAFKSTSGQPVTFTVDFTDASKPVLKITQDNGTPSVTYFIQGDFNSWGTGSYFSGSGNELTATVPNWKNSDGNGNNDGFLLKGSNSKNYSTGSVLNNKTAATVSEGATHMTLNGAEGKEVTFTLTLNNGNPSTLKASWDEGGSGGDVTSDVQIKGNISDFYSGGATWSAPQGLTSLGDNEYGYTFTTTKAATNDSPLKFRIIYNNVEYISETDKSNNSATGVDLTTSTNYEWTQAKGVPATDSGNNANNYWQIKSLDANKTYTIMVKLVDGKPRVKYIEGEPVPVRKNLPVFPVGVNNEEELSTYTDPVYYLLGSVINNGYITPEYQFVKAGEDVAKINATYSGANVSAESLVLEFTIHNTSTQVEGASTDGFSVVGYATPDSEKDTILKNIVWNGLSSKNAHRAGNACVAVFDPDAKTCNFYLKENGQQPFISLIGRNWKQNTITNGEKPFTTHRGNTDNGWQEAWIQYTEGGTIAKDRDGAVMYNTQFPPKNPIKFKTVFKLNGTDYDFTVDSDELVFVPTGLTKTGEQWKADTETFEELRTGEVTATDLHGKKNGSYTTNLALNEGEKYFANKLALDDSRSYTLYRVDNVWINGDVKLWSGWTAGNHGDMANWSNHANWGHFGESESATGIAASSSVPLSNRNGDVSFGDPTYFKSIYFFLDTENGYDPKYSVLFSELAYGGAEIAALNNTDYTHGYFRPGLSELSNVAEGNVQKVKIDCYTDDRATLMSTVFNDQSVEDTKNTKFHTLFDNHHTSDMGDVESTAASSKAKWLYDDNSYPNGNYRYKMEVTFTDNNQNSHTVVVWSNPFTIFRGEASATLKAYQLVKILDEHEEGYNYYYTFDPVTLEKDKNGVPSKPETVYKVKVGVQGQNTSTGNIESWEGDPLQSDLMPKYVSSEEVTDASGIDFGDGSKYRFSCKVLLVGDIVGQNITTYELTNATKASITGDYVEKENDPVLTADKHRFYFVVEPLIKKNGFKYGYTWKPSFSYKFTDSNNEEHEKNGNSEISVEGCLVIPQPKLIEEHSRLEMFYGDNDSADTDNDTRSFSYSVSGDNAVVLGAGARFQQVRKAIVIERPNVTMRFRALAKDYITSKTPDSGIAEGSTKAPLVVGLFDFTVGDEAVVINNGSKYPNSEGLDWYLYHSTTKNPADYYFKGFEGFNYTWDPEGNIGVTKYYEPREMKSSVRDAFKDVKFFPRWKDGMISGLRISQDAPVNALAEGTYKDAIGSSNGDNAVRITRSSLIYAEADAGDIKKGDLIEQVTVKVNLASKTGNVVARVNEKGLPLTEDGKVVETGYEGAGKEMQRTDFITTGNDAQAAAGTETVEKGTTDYFLVRVVDKTTQKDLMNPQAVSAKDMYDGKEFAVTANHGHWWDGQLETVKADPLYKRMQVRISHLYPFVAGTKGTTVDTTTPASAPRRAAAEEATASDENVVIKSDAMLREFAGNDIPTAVIGVEDAMRDSVVAGMGFIEAHGEGVEIYGADGIRIASGEGRHEVPAGVYVVRLNGRAEKVIVR